MAEYDYKEYARQMRTNAVKDENGIIRCSPELWEQIASIIEKSEEVKHGEWKSYNTECSICKRINPTLFLDEFFGKYKALHLEYCPHCGAKMDGKDDAKWL